MPITVNELFGAFVVSKKGPGKLISIDTSVIKVTYLLIICHYITGNVFNLSIFFQFLQKMPGVMKFLSAKDIPGKNTFVEESKVEDEKVRISTYMVKCFDQKFIKISQE